MPVNDAMRNRQAHCSAFVFLSRVQSLEHTEQLVNILHIKTHSIILDEIDLFAIRLGQTAYLNSSDWASTCELERVGKQADPDLSQQRRVALAGGQLTDRDFAAALPAQRASFRAPGAPIRPAGWIACGVGGVPAACRLTVHLPGFPSAGRYHG